MIKHIGPERFGHIEFRIEIIGHGEIDDRDVAIALARLRRRGEVEGERGSFSGRVLLQRRDVTGLNLLGKGDQGGMAADLIAKGGEALHGLVLFPGERQQARLSLYAKRQTGAEIEQVAKI